MGPAISPYIDGMRRSGALSDQRWRGARAWTTLAVSALVIVSCASTAGIAQAAPAAADVVLVGLDDAAAVGSWTTVNDPVMGGLSTSTVSFGEGGLVFSGSISLDNNGGFASARGPQDPDIGRRAAGATSLGVRALGDGKTYLLKLESAGRPWSYIQRFPTRAGEWQTYDLPIGSFQPVGMFLNPAPEAPQTLDPSTISRVAVYILDKQQGPFQITVAAISAFP